MLLSFDPQNIEPVPVKSPIQGKFQQVQSKLETHEFFALLNKQ